MLDTKVEKHAWPGGYAIGYVCDDGELLCADCVNDEDNPTHKDGEADGWRIDGYQLEEEGFNCAHCGMAVE